MGPASFCLVDGAVVAVDVQITASQRPVDAGW